MQAHIVEALYHQSAALVVFQPHFFNFGITLTHGHHSRILAGGGGRHNAALMDLGHCLDDRRRAAGIAKAPARHGVGLGKAVHHNGALLHAGQRCDRNMTIFAVVQLGIDLIRKHHNVGAAQHLGNFFQMLLFHHSTRGVVGERQHQKLGFWRDGCAQLVGSQAEIILLARGQVYRHAAC